MDEAAKRERDWKRRGINFGGGPLMFSTFRAVVDFQGGACAICGTPESAKPLVADHAHFPFRDIEEDANNFRGALCSDCNHHLGDAFNEYFRVVVGGLSLKPRPVSEQDAVRAKHPAECAYFDNPPAKRWADSRRG